MLAEFDAARYKARHRGQWQSAADAWHTLIVAAGQK
jgi:hypothetical protein